MRSKKKRLSSRKLLCWNMRDVIAFATVVTALLFITARARAHKVNYEFEVRARMIRVNNNASQSPFMVFVNKKFNKASLIF